MAQNNCLPTKKKFSQHKKGVVVSEGPRPLNSPFESYPKKKNNNNECK